MSFDDPDSAALQPLILRANRFLGAALVEAEMINFGDLEQASEFLLERLQSKDLSRTNVIAILQTDLRALNENDLIRLQVEQHNLSLFNVALSPPVVHPSIQKNVCWATWTVPYDEQEGIWFLASAYYLSKPVRDFWEKRLDAPIEWSVAECRQIAEAIAKIPEPA